MSEWQPIETAPKDGAEVLAAKESSRPIGVRFPYPLTSKFLHGVWKAKFGKDDWRSYEPQPTHWRPIPESRK